MKKAQGISMNVIIIAAIALLVLVVLSMIFLGKIGTWGSDVDACNNKGGQCVSADMDCSEATNGEKTTENMLWSCPEDQKCCIAITT